MTHDTYQEMSPVQSLIIVNALRQFLTRPRLAFTFFACGTASDWESVFGYVEIPRLPGAEFQVGGRTFRTGDYHGSPPGNDHGEARTSGGCLLLIQCAA